MGMDFFAAYAEDPDVKFILIVRNAHEWTISVNNICPFLCVPDGSYPQPNNPALFKAIVEGFLQRSIRAAVMKFSVVVILTLSVLV